VAQLDFSWGCAAPHVSASCHGVEKKDELPCSGTRLCVCVEMDKGRKGFPGRDLAANETAVPQ